MVSCRSAGVVSCFPMVPHWFPMIPLWCPLISDVSFWFLESRMVFYSFPLVSSGFLLIIERLIMVSYGFQLISYGFLVVSYGLLLISIGFLRFPITIWYPRYYAACMKSWATTFCAWARYVFFYYYAGCTPNHTGSRILSVATIYVFFERAHVQKVKRRPCQAT